MKKSILVILSVLALAACHDKRYETVPVAFQGGKGGIYEIVCYTKHADTGVKARVFIKYATNIVPGDTSAYDERVTAGPDTAQSPFVRFTELKTGSYIIKAVYKTYSAERSIYIPETQVLKTEITLDLK